MTSHHTQNVHRILVCSTALSAYLEDTVQMGIRRFALGRPDWQLGHLHAEETDDNHVRDVLRWNPDGILIVARPSQVPKLMVPKECPAMVVDLYHEHVPKISRVEVDDTAIGRRAAEFFLRNRFEHFGLIVWPGNPPFSRLRSEGFAHRLKSAGKTCVTFETSYTCMQPWHRNPDLETWLQELPKPVALYCVNDLTAMRIQEHCARLKIRIPSEASVLGTDNNLFLCESVRPLISSIPQPLELTGFRAAELLAEQIQVRDDGGNPYVIHEEIQPGEVVERQSTSLRALPDPAVARAANYLHDHVLRGGTIARAAREAGLNRRALERGFKRHLGITPGEYVREVKIEHAKRLLSSTDLRMSDIAGACLMSQEHFSTFFKSSTGQSPSQYRRTVKTGEKVYPEPSGDAVPPG